MEPREEPARTVDAMDAMDAIVDDLVAEQQALDAALAGVPAARWDAPSPAEGWRLRDCIAHLAEFDERAAAIAERGEAPPAGRPGSGVLTAVQLELRERSVDELRARWRAARARLERALRPLDPAARLPWMGREMSARTFATARLMECWSHGLDALEAAGLPPIVSDRLRHVAHLGYQTREFAYRNRDMEPNSEPLRVELTAPSGATWTWGPADAPHRVTGPALDFCRVVTQRISYLDTDLRWQGWPAEEFLLVAQAFAGPPGSGRAVRGDHRRDER